MALNKYHMRFSVEQYRQSKELFETWLEVAQKRFTGRTAGDKGDFVDFVRGTYQKCLELGFPTAEMFRRFACEKQSDWYSNYPRDRKCKGFYGRWPEGWDDNSERLLSEGQYLRKRKWQPDSTVSEVRHPDERYDPVLRTLVTIASVEKQRKTEYRGGQDVTVAELCDTFGLRGVAVGGWEWNAQSRRMTDLAHHAPIQRLTNVVYDSLMELAELIGQDSRTIGLRGGRIADGISIGLGVARLGDVRNCASFRASDGMLNVMDNFADGSLAYEWMRALFHQFIGPRWDSWFAGHASAVEGPKSFRILGISNPVEIEGVIDEQLVFSHDLLERHNMYRDATVAVLRDVYDWKYFKPEQLMRRADERSTLSMPNERLTKDLMEYRKQVRQLRRQLAGVHAMWCALAELGNTDSTSVRCAELTGHILEAWGQEQPFIHSFSNDLVGGVVPPIFTTRYKSTTGALTIPPPDGLSDVRIMLLLRQLRKWCGEVADSVWDSLAEREVTVEQRCELLALGMDFGQWNSGMVEIDSDGSRFATFDPYSRVLTRANHYPSADRDGKVDESVHGTRHGFWLAAKLCYLGEQKAQYTPGDDHGQLVSDFFLSTKALAECFSGYESSTMERFARAGEAAVEHLLREQKLQNGMLVSDYARCASIGVGEALFALGRTIEKYTLEAMLDQLEDIEEHYYTGEVDLVGVFSPNEGWELEGSLVDDLILNEMEYGEESSRLRQEGEALQSKHDKLVDEIEAWGECQKGKIVLKDDSGASYDPSEYPHGGQLGIMRDTKYESEHFEPLHIDYTDYLEYSKIPDDDMYSQYLYEEDRIVAVIKMMKGDLWVMNDSDLSDIAMLKAKMEELDEKGVDLLTRAGALNREVRRWFKRMYEFRVKPMRELAERIRRIAKEGGNVQNTGRSDGEACGGRIPLYPQGRERLIMVELIRSIMANLHYVESRSGKWQGGVVFDHVAFRTPIQVEEMRLFQSIHDAFAECEQDAELKRRIAPVVGELDSNEPTTELIDYSDWMMTYVRELDMMWTNEPSRLGEVRGKCAGLPEEE